MNKILELRKKAGISQTTLGIQAGINPASINRYERGVNPNKATAARIAKALNVSPEELFDGFATLRAY